MGSLPLASSARYKFQFFRIFMVLLCCPIPYRKDLWFNMSHVSPPFLTNNTLSNISSLKTINLDGYLSFDDDDINHAANDFGNINHFLPTAVLYPKSVSDISSMITHVFNMGSASKLTIAAKGHAHSLLGQAQAHQGIVINMESLKVPRPKVNIGNPPYVEVSGGELWINILHETLKYGLAPKSWTDYLHLTAGGTLSSAGISGQAFRHGPQINNVYQLEVVTGMGEVLTCSERQNSELFHAALGGLGQFGIITKARISLEPAPKMVKWIRVLYLEFSKFTRDQEHLILSENSFDYIEGFVIINRTGLINHWRSSFDPKDPLEASQFISEGKTLYCLEIAKYFNPNDSNDVNQITESLLSELSYIRSTLFMSEVSYVEFLDRVHVSEIKLRAKDLWEVPHPWMNLLIPKSNILAFAEAVFGSILKDNRNGPILIYPVNKSKWTNKTSIVTPEEEIFYLVAFLFSAVPFSTGRDSLEHIWAQNKKVIDFYTTARLGVKQYLPHYSTQEEWQAHYGSMWEVFVQRKLTYDPLAILAPGQKIFRRNDVPTAQRLCKPQCRKYFQYSHAP